MTMGQQKDRQGDLMVGWAEMPRSPGHVFYDRLQSVLIEGGFDGFAEAACRSYYAARLGAPSVPPGRYFRMHLVGYFEGIDSERGLEWRCSDSLSLREFLRLESRDRVPDHSWLSRTRARLPHEVHTAIFDWVLALIAEAGLVKGERIGVDASTMEANAALRNIVRRDTGEGYRGMLARLAQESGIETPTAEDLARLDRKRKGKKLSNQDWVSKSDPEAKIAKMKDGTTHLAYKPEHAVDLDTGAVVAAELHPADEGDTTTLEKTLAAAKENLEAVDAAPTAEDPAECVTDKGYHSRSVLKALDDGPWKTRISEPKQLQERVEDGDPRRRQAPRGDGLADSLVHRRPDALVERGLGAFERDKLVDHRLFRQVAGNLLLGAPHQEGLHPGGQQPLLRAIAVLLYRGPEFRREALAVAEQPRDQPVVERPQLLEIVFQRRPCQRQALAGANLPDAFRDGRGRVLHRLRLVQHGGVVIVGEQRFMVPVQQRIGRDHQMVPGDIGETLPAFGPVKHQELQLRHKPCGLAPPVADQAGRYHQKARKIGLLLQMPMRQQGERLHGLAEPHVVGQ